MKREARTEAQRATRATGGEVRQALKVLTKEELTRQLLALVLTAVLVWHTVLVPSSSHAPAKRPRRRSPGDEARAAQSRRNMLGAGTTWVAGGPPDESAADSVDELDWPEFIGLD